jgi:hypothetical protein
MEEQHRLHKDTDCVLILQLIPTSNAYNLENSYIIF